MCEQLAHGPYVKCRDGPKFGRHRSSAEEFGRMFGSVRLGNMRLFGRSSAELRQTFGVNVASNWRRFALAAGVNKSQYTILLVTSQLTNYVQYIVSS